MKSIPYLILLCLLVFASCVPNRQYVYMQKNDRNGQDVPIDTMVRSYDRSEFEYRLQPEDIVSVRFESLTPKDFDFLNQNQSAQSMNVNLTQGNALLIGELIDEKGEIPFPFLGKVKIGGLTVFETQDTLMEIGRKYLDQPVVKVRLLNLRFTALGEVNNEGTIVLTNNRVTMLEALGLVGGLTDMADKAHVKLIRQQNGKTDVQYINLLDENFVESPYYYIHQNDVLVVGALRQRPYIKYFGQNLSIALSALSLLLLTITIIQ